MDLTWKNMACHWYMLFKPWRVHNKAGEKGNIRTIFHNFPTPKIFFPQVSSNPLIMCDPYQTLNAFCTLFVSRFSCWSHNCACLGCFSFGLHANEIGLQDLQNLAISFKQYWTNPQNHYENLRNMSWYWYELQENVPPKGRWRHRCPCHYNWNHQRSQELLPPGSVHPKWLAGRLWFGVR